MTEELATYLNFSLFMTLLISLISIFLIIGLYIRKGRYEFEERIFIKNFVIYYIVNLLIYIILCQLVGKWLLFNTSSPHIELIAKMNQYMQRLV
jgi:Na+-driven multidrug efflux pump